MPFFSSEELSISAMRVHPMLIDVSTRRLKWAVQLPEGDVTAGLGSGTAKSAASRQFRGVVRRKIERVHERGPVEARPLRRPDRRAAFR